MQNRIRQTAASPATLPEVVVTGTRIEQQVRKIPANVSVITPADIQNTNAKTAADLLRGEEGIVVRDPLGNGNTAAVDLRGFGETATQNALVLVDGRRANEVDLSAVDWAQIPIEQIERIEIVRGSGTVLYGDNATAGVINIITKSPSQKFSASGGVTLGSYNRGKVDAYASGGYKRTAVSLYGSLEETDGYRENNDYHSGDLGGKLIFDATDRLTLNLSGSYHKDRFGLAGNPNPSRGGRRPQTESGPGRQCKNPRFLYHRRDRLGFRRLSDRSWPICPTEKESVNPSFRMNPFHLEIMSTPTPSDLRRGTYGTERFSVLATGWLPGWICTVPSRTVNRTRVSLGRCRPLPPVSQTSIGILMASISMTSSTC